MLPHLRDDSVVFVHDFYARVPHYAPLLRYYREVARVLAARNARADDGPLDEPQGLLVLRRRPGLRLPLPAAEIHAAYAGRAWREPFPAPPRGLAARAAYYPALAADWGRWRRARTVDDLVECVRHDLLALALVYALVMFAVRNWPTLVAARARAPPALQAPPHPPPRDRDDPDPRPARRGKPEPRFVETEAMKTAQARRKMRAKPRPIV